MGFSEFLGHCSSVKAEIRAVLRGLCLAKEAHAQRLWLQIDSNIVVNMLLHHQPVHPDLSRLLHKCKCLIKWEGWEIRISHCPREANQVADILANMGCAGTSGVSVYSLPPRDVREALYADSLGVYWPRRRKVT